MEKKLLYHITHYQNLYSILKNKGLSAYSKVTNEEAIYTNIAHQGLQGRRSTTNVPVYPNGCLHDYVPFYFASRSPMLYAIIQGQVDGFEGTEEEIVYIMTRTDRIQDAGLPFVFTDGHAIMSITEFYNDLSKLTKVDWDIMREWYWNDTEEDPDRKRRRQAEFLVHDFVGIQHFIGFAVRNEKMKQIVQEILVEYEIDLPVAIRKHFYFGR